jgi:SAM-dependent methyltransferase
MSRIEAAEATVEPVRRTVSEQDTLRANRADWDGYADEYQAAHGPFLGDVGFVWCPEGVEESDAGLLGDVAGLDVLEIGCGAGQCARWLTTRGARAVGLDLSHRQLQHSARIDQATGHAVPVVCATATALPFADASFDVAFSAFGALQFVASAQSAVDEAARVLRPSGRFVFSVTHPTRWMFPDDPSARGLLASQSYFDRRPYVEQDPDTGRPTYVEHHRTLGDWVRALHAADFTLHDLVEPEWPPGHERVWGGWSPLRGRLTPGTAIFCSSLDRP